MANGNNHNFTDFSTWGTPSLSCIIVDQANWTPFDLLSVNQDANVNIDDQTILILFVILFWISQYFRK